MEVVKDEEVKAPQQDISHNEFIDSVIDNIDKNEFTIHIYCPAMNTPSGGIGVLLRLARELKDNGNKVKIWYEPKFDQKASMEASNKAKKRIDLFDQFHPNWVDFNISDLDFVPLGDTTINFINGTSQDATPLKVDTQDFMLIPEGFPNIMEKTTQVTCKRIVLAQSWLYVLSGMQNGQTWKNFGINDVISVSDAITEFLDTVMPGMNIKNIRQGINREIFKPPAKRSEKYPCIGFVNGRDSIAQLKLYNMIKMFALTYPHLRWVKFIELSNLSREEFADRLKTCAFVLYADDVAGFGTLPLEAMACGTHVIGWAAFGGKEYVRKNNGFWCNNGDVFQMAEMIGVALEKWLSGEMDMEDTQATYEDLLNGYTVQGEADRIVAIMEEYKKERKHELERAKKQ
jgi:hypothetical protein